LLSRLGSTRVRESKYEVSIAKTKERASGGGHTYDVDINMSPERVADFNQLPVKVERGSPLLLGRTNIGCRAAQRLTM
jgi:hypothetical protein